MKSLPLAARPLPALSLPLALVVLLAPAAAAQRSERAVREDFELARRLASEWQFVGMAEDVLRRVKSGGVSGELAVELELVQCQVYVEGARNEANPERRIELYENAVQTYEGFIAENAFFANIAEAKRDYVDVTNTFARYLAYRLDETVGEQAAAYRARIRELLEMAVSSTQDLIEEAEDPKVKQRLMLSRGQMYLLLGEIANDPFALGQAAQTLEDLALAAGERTPLGLQAYLELGRVLVQQGQPSDAIGFFDFVHETALPRDPETWAAVKQEASQAELDARWEFAQLVIRDQLAAYLAQGQVKEATTWALHFYNTWRRDGFNLKRQGYEGVLAVARTVLDSGGWIGGKLNSGKLGWYETLQQAIDAKHTTPNDRRSGLDFALSLAQQVNTDNRGTVLQLKAQKLISDIISRPGANPAPDVLIEAAEGDYYNGDTIAAVSGFKRVLRALESRDSATQQLYAPKVYYRLGQSYSKLGRPLESAIAFREGIERYNGDPEFDGQNAKGYLDQVKVVRRWTITPDPLVESQLHNAERLLEKYTPDDAGEVIFNQAERLWSQGESQAARVRFLEVTPDAGRYEVAKVKAAVALERAGELDQAKRELESYMREFVPDPKNALSSDVKKSRRREAEAMATFYLGRIAGRQKDFDGVVEWLSGYDKTFPDQSSYAPTALNYLIVAQLEKDDFAAATGSLDRLLAFAEQTNDPQASDAAAASSLRIYKVYQERRQKALDEGNAAEAKRIVEAMVPLLQKRNKLTGDPGYPGLREESELWMALENWAEAERVLRELARRFGTDTDPVMRDRMRLYVLPDLGQVLVKQSKVHDALVVLAPLMPPLEPPKGAPEGPKPTRNTIRSYCMALGGWIQGTDSEIVEVAGVGGKENLELACAWWDRLQASEEKWTAPWYELKLQLGYASFQRGLVDSENKDARLLLNDLKTWTGQDFALVAETAGNDLLRRRFVWLDRKVP